MAKLRRNRRSLSTIKNRLSRSKNAEAGSLGSNFDPGFRLEALEPRVLLSASLVDGLLTVMGTADNDRVTVRADGDGEVIVRANFDVGAGEFTGVDAIVIDTDGGNDRVNIRGTLRDSSGDVMGVTIDTGAGKDRVGGSPGDDTIDGGADNDKIKGGDGDDVIDGGAGNDKIKGGKGDDDIDGGDGNDKLLGEDGDDTLNGGAGSDRLRGGDDDDLLIGGAGVDRIAGDRGTDTVSYETSDAGVDVHLGRRRADDDGFGDRDRGLRRIENITGSPFDDMIVGNRRPNTIDGGGGDDTITDPRGTDTIIDGGGGGGGGDPASVSLESISPIDGEELVSVTRETIVRFDGEVDPTTVSTESFSLIASGEAVPGTVTVSSTGMFATFFYTDPLPSSTEVRVVIDGDVITGADGVPLDADGDGFAGGVGTADFTTLPLTRIAGTNVFGFIRDSITGDPIEGATVRVDAFPEADAVTDATGRFELMDMPAPEFFVHLDGSTAVGIPEGFTYPSVGKALHSVPGETVQLNNDGVVFDVFLPPIALADFTPLSVDEPTVVGFGESGKAELVALFPEIDPALWDLFNVTIDPGSATADDGTPATEATIIPVPADRLPAPLPPDLNPALVISIQTPGATNFDVPAAITFPNLDGLAPGEKATIFSFNHDAGRFEAVGLGTVSEDGTVITSDPGVGILAPGWHFTSPPLNWTGSGGPPEGNQPVDEETPPEIEVRLFTTSESDTLSFTFTPPPGEGAMVGEHELPSGETEPSRVVTITIEGIFFDHFYDNSGATGLKAETITLRPGDAPVTRSATLRNLMDILARDNGGKPFDIDQVYGAKITVEEVLTLADGSRSKSSRIVLPYLYVDQGDEAPEDTVLKFRPSIHAGSFFTGRQFSVGWTAGAPLPDFIFEGAAAGDFSDTLVDGEVGIKSNPGGAGDRNAEMKVEVTVNGAKHQSTNSVSVLSKGMEPVTVYLDKANFKTVATTLTDVALKKTDAEAEAFFTSTKARIQTLITDVGGDANMAILLSDAAAAPAGGTGRTITVNWNFSDDEWVDTNGDGVTQIGEVGDVDGDGTFFETPGDYTDTNGNGMPDAGEFFGAVATDVTGDGMITAGDYIDLNGNGRFDRNSVLGRAFTGVDFNTTLFADKLVTNKDKFGKQQQAYIFDSVFEAAPIGSFEMFIDNTFDDGVGLTPAGQQPTKLGNVVTHEVFHTLGEVHSDNMGIGGNDIMNHITNWQRANTNTSRFVARTGSDANVSVVELVDTAVVAYRTGYAARAMAPAAFPSSIEAEALIAGASLIVFDEDVPGAFEEPLEGVGPAFNLSDDAADPVLETFDFGGVVNDGAAGTVSTFTLTIDNSGATDLELMTISLTDGGQGFSLTGIADGAIIAPGASTTFDLTFDPTVDGLLTDTLSFATNIDSIVEGETVTIDITLLGIGLDPDPVFNLNIFADNNNLGGAVVGDQVTADELLTITNTGAADLVFTPIVGVGSLDFNIGAFEGVEQTLATGETLVIPVTFTPTATGLRPGAVEFDTNDPDETEFDQGVVGTGIPDGPIEFDWGGDYVVIEYNGFTQRDVSNMVGFFQFGIPVMTEYEITIFDPASGLIANGVGVSGPAGAFTDLTTALSFLPSTAPDTDGEGLPDDIENAIGTSIVLVDTNDDGISDFQTVQLGLNPLAGVAFPTGVVASLDLTGNSLAVVVEGTADGGLAAYVATGTHGLAIVDVSVIDSPIIQGQLDLPGNATDVAVDTNLQIAAVATGGSGVQLVDVSDPMLPVVIDTVGVGASQIEATGGFAFATSGTTLSVIDLVAGETVQTLILPGSGQVTGLARKGELLGAYISGSDTFALIDITNPEESVVVGSTNVSVASSNVGIFLGNGVAWVAGSGLRTVDITDPTAPVLQHGADTFFTARRFALNGSGLGLLTPDGGSSVSVYDTSNPDDTDEIVATHDLGSAAQDVVISGGVGFVATSGGLEVVNFLALDSAGEPPTVEITSPIEDTDPMTDGLQVIEGTSIPIIVEVTDDVQVRSVELLVDGEVVSTDVSFPFDFSAIALSDDPDAPAITVQARATDTGGNSTVSAPFVIDLVPDMVAPTIESITPADGATQFEGLRSVRVRLSESIKPAGVSTDTFGLTSAGDNGIHGDADDVDIPVTVDLRDGNQLVQLLTDDALPAGEYQLTIDGTAISDNSDNPLSDGDINSTFSLIERPSVDDLFALRGELVEGGITLVSTDLMIGFNTDGSFIRNDRSTGLIFADVEFLTPGAPLASFTISRDGENFTNSSPDGGSATTVTIENLSVGDFFGVRITGVVGENLMLERVVVFNEGERFVTIATQLTNLTEEPLTNVAWLENMDPDQSTSIGIGSATNNDVTLEGTFVLGGALNDEFPAGLTIGLGTPDVRATVSAESFTVTDPFTIIGSPEDPDGARADIAINLAFDYGDLGPLEAVSSSLTMSLGRSIDEAVANYLAAVGLTGAEIGGGEAPGGGGGDEPV